MEWICRFHKKLAKNTVIGGDKRRRTLQKAGQAIWKILLRFQELWVCEIPRFDCCQTVIINGALAVIWVYVVSS